MTREETIKAIKIMQHFADGGDIEVSTKNDACFNRIPCDDPDIKAKEILWNWEAYDYRIKPKSMKVTEEEKDYMAGVWVKLKNTNSITYVKLGAVIDNKNYYVLNPDTMEWEDWENTYEEAKLRHHYNGGQP